MSMTRGWRVLGTVAVGATMLAAVGGAEANTAFCGRPIPVYGGWCDPIVPDTQEWTVNNAMLYPPDAGSAKWSIAAHRRITVSMSSVIELGRDADGKTFCAPAAGNPQVGEKLVSITSKSLGAVTRNAANGNMPHGVRIDDAALDGNPQAVVIAARIATPGASKSPVGAWYHGQHWWLYNEDLAPMATGETFLYAEGRGAGGQAVHTQDNDYQGTGLYLDDARINGNPSAVVIPLHAFTGAYNPSALGIWYDAVRGQWVVYKESGSAPALGQTIHYVAVP